MASAVIHLAVAKELLPYLEVANVNEYYLGSIAPDIAKLVGETKQKSHFLYNEREDVPNIKMFTNKYKDFKKNSFDLGYYIHLFTDKIWFDKFLRKLVQNSSVKLLDGTIIECSKEQFVNLIYSDYTNLNIELIDEYNIDLSLFYEEFQIPNTKIEEIPKDKLYILINEMGIIIENFRQEKEYILDIFLIESFISEVKERILSELKNYS